MLCILKTNVLVMRRKTNVNSGRCCCSVHTILALYIICPKDKRSILTMLVS